MMDDFIEKLVSRLSKSLGRIERPHLAIALFLLFLLGMALGLWSYGVWSTGDLCLASMVFLLGQFSCLVVVGIGHLSATDSIRQIAIALEGSLPAPLDRLFLPTMATIERTVDHINTSSRDVGVAVASLAQSSVSLKSILAEFESVIGAGKRIRSAADLYKDSIEKSAREQDHRALELIALLERGSNSAVKALKGAEVAWEQNGPVLAKALEKALLFENVLKALQQRIDRTVASSILEAARQLAKIDDETLLGRVLGLQEFLFVSKEVVSSARQMRMEAEDSLGALRAALNKIERASKEIAEFSPSGLEVEGTKL
jgi:hypothetical protein